MENQKLTKTELSEQLAEKLEYYFNDPLNRCRKDGMCRYSGETLGISSEGCMVGLFLEPEFRKELDRETITNENISGSIEDIIARGPEHILERIPAIVKDNAEIMQSFQSFHDMDLNWRIKFRNGITLRGQHELEKLISKHKLDRKPFEKFLN